MAYQRSRLEVEPLASYCDPHTSTVYTPGAYGIGPFAPADLAPLDDAASRAAAAIGSAAGAFHGYVSAEQVAFLYLHTETMSAELFPLTPYKCPRVTVGLEVKDRRNLGSFLLDKNSGLAGRDALGIGYRVNLNLIHLDRSPAAALSTLLHEMLHAAQAAAGIPIRNNYHPKSFVEACDVLGIPTNSQGYDLGITPAGAFDNYCKRHNVAGRPSLSADPSAAPLPSFLPVPAPRPSGSKMHKWACQGCARPMIVRCARALSATCNTCGTAFVQA